MVVLDHDVLAAVRPDEDRRRDVPSEVEGTEEEDLLDDDIEEV